VVLISYSAHVVPYLTCVKVSLSFFFNHPPPPEIYTLSLHDALPISGLRRRKGRSRYRLGCRSPPVPRRSLDAARPWGSSSRRWGLRGPSTPRAVRSWHLHR